MKWKKIRNFYSRFRMPIPVYLLNEYNCLMLVTMVTWSRPEPVTGQW